MDSNRPKRKIQKPKRYKTTSSDDDNKLTKKLNSTAIHTEIKDIRVELQSYKSSKTPTILQNTMNTSDNVPAECERNVSDTHVQQSRDMRTQNTPNIMYSQAESTHFYSTFDTRDPYTECTPPINQIANRVHATPYLPQQNDNSYTQMLNSPEYAIPNYSVSHEQNDNQAYLSGIYNTIPSTLANYYESHNNLKSHTYSAPQPTVVQCLSSPTVTTSNNKVYLDIASTSEIGKPTISTTLHSATTSHSTQVNTKPRIVSDIVLKRKPLTEIQSTALQPSTIDDLLAYVNI